MKVFEQDSKKNHSWLREVGDSQPRLRLRVPEQLFQCWCPGSVADALSPLGWGIEAFELSR